MPDKRLIDFTDTELSNALHFIEGHDACFEDEEQVAWNTIRDMVIRVATNNRSLDSEGGA